MEFIRQSSKKNNEKSAISPDCCRQLLKLGVSPRSSAQCKSLQIELKQELKQHKHAKWMIDRSSSNELFTTSRNENNFLTVSWEFFEEMLKTLKFFDFTFESSKDLSKHEL